MNDSLDKQFIIFDLNSERYAVPISKVEEIVKITKIVKVPKSENFVVGIMDIRGKIIKMIDLSVKLKISEPISLDLEKLEKNAIILNFSGKSIGIIVDKVSNVLRFSNEDIDNSFNQISSIPKTYILGIAKKNDQFITIVDIEKIFSSVDSESIA